MNPMGLLFAVLGVLIIIMAVKGSYKNIASSLKNV